MRLVKKYNSQINLSVYKNVSTAVAVCFDISSVNNELDEILRKTAHIVHMAIFRDPKNLLQTTEGLFKEM